MKKFIYILLIMLLFLSGCSSDKDPINYISLDEYVEKINSDDDFVLVVGRIDCSACIAFKPILQETATSKDLKIDYVQIDETWTDEDRATLLEETQKTYDFNLTGTPTTLIVKDGKLVDKITGQIEYRDLIHVLKEHNIVE